MNERQCWNCKFWDWKNQNIHSGDSGQEDTIHGLGKCKKHSKITKDDESCDDYEPKSQYQKQ